MQSGMGMPPPILALFSPSRELAWSVCATLNDYAKVAI